MLFDVVLVQNRAVSSFLSKHIMYYHCMLGYLHIFDLKGVLFITVNLSNMHLRFDSVCYYEIGSHFW